MILWIFVAICSSWLSVLVGPIDCIQCPYRAKCLLVGHMKEFVGKRHLCVRSYFSSMSFRLTWMLCEMGGKKPLKFCEVLIPYIYLYGSAMNKLSDLKRELAEDIFLNSCYYAISVAILMWNVEHRRFVIECYKKWFLSTDFSSCDYPTPGGCLKAQVFKYKSQISGKLKYLIHREIAAIPEEMSVQMQ